ncbi:MAG: hypothetical protein AAGC56_10070 [Pseudomonadota bacterium]
MRMRAGSTLAIAAAATLSVAADAAASDRRDRINPPLIEVLPDGAVETISKDGGAVYGRVPTSFGYDAVFYTVLPKGRTQKIDVGPKTGERSRLQYRRLRMVGRNGAENAALNRLSHGSTPTQKRRFERIGYCQIDDAMRRAVAYIALSSSFQLQ